MKKFAVIGAVALAGTLIASGAQAGGFGRGMGPCGGGYGPASADRAKLMTETLPERQLLMEKRTQLATLMADPKADPAKVGALVQEVQRLQTSLHEKAANLGFGPGYGAGMMRGRGPGWGFPTAPAPKTN